MTDERSFVQPLNENRLREILDERDRRLLEQIRRARFPPLIVHSPVRGTLHFDRIDIVFVNGFPWMVFFYADDELCRKRFEDYEVGRALTISGIRGTTDYEVGS